MMKTLLPILAFALFVPAASAQTLFASSTFGNGDNGNYIQHTAEAATGPLIYSDSQILAFGGATYQGTTRTASDYGKIGVYSRSDLDNGSDAPSYIYASAGGGFIDPLTITGGTAGGTIHAEMRMRGTPDIELSTYYSYYSNVEFYSLQDGGYVPVENQTFEWHDNGIFGENIDLTVGVTLADYDPSLTYYLNGVAVVSAEVDRNNSPSIHASVDAEHTAEITKIGFVGANGELSGGFVGASGHVYAPVPEPACLLALGAGLVVLRRRPNRKG